MATRKQAKNSVHRSERVNVTGEGQVASMPAAATRKAPSGRAAQHSVRPEIAPDGAMLHAKAEKPGAKVERKRPGGFMPRRPAVAPKVLIPRQSPVRVRTAGPQSKSLLPKRMMLDASVIIMALEHDNPRLRRDPTVKDARELWERALAECTVLLPPFIVLELLLGGVSTPLPALRNLMHVAFTYEVAESMGNWASMPAPGTNAQRTGKTQAIAAARSGRYDALIVGTAKFYGADVLVTRDAATKAMAKAAGVVTQDPAELLRWTQRGLPGI